MDTTFAAALALANSLDSEARKICELQDAKYRRARSESGRAAAFRALDRAENPLPKVPHGGEAEPMNEPRTA